MIPNMKRTPQEWAEAFTHVKLTGVFSSSEAFSSEDGEEEKVAKMGFTISWGAKEIGFGEAVFYFRNDQPSCDSEAMSAAFIEGLLIAYARTLEIRG